MRSHIILPMAKIYKRKYEKRLFDRALNISENRNFLVERLRREWEEIEKEIEKDRKKQKLYNLAKETTRVVGLTLLCMIAICGVVVVAATAPNIFSAFGHSGKYRRYFDKKRLTDRVYYFKRRKYIEMKRNGKNNAEIKLTDCGKEQIIRHVLSNFKMTSQKHWDGVWRVVIFDIPEKNKWAREGLRYSLKRLGFYQLQKSTFVFPYPCKDEIEFLGRLYDRDNYIRFIETKTISYDDDLRNQFQL